MTGTNVEFEVETGTEEQADTVLDIVTQNDDTENNDDSASFSTTFATTASDSYSAYTGSQTYDSVDGAYEQEETSESSTGIYVAFLAALIVIVCLVAFILFGWYKRHKLKQYFERRERVKDRFKKATTTIGQMRRLGKMTAFLKAKDQAFSFQNLEKHHREAASNLLGALNEAGGNVEQERDAIAAENDEIKKKAKWYNTSGNKEYAAATDAEKAKMVLAEIEQAGSIKGSDDADVKRVLDNLKKSEGYLSAGRDKQEEMMKAKLAKRRQALKDRRAAAAHAAVTGAAMPGLASSGDADLFNEEAELERVKEETKKMQKYQEASSNEQRAIMQAKLNERKAMLRARRAGAAMHDDLVKERVQEIVEEAASKEGFEIVKLDHDDEAELARLREETEKSILYQDQSYFEQQENMRNVLEKRRAALLEARQKASSAQQLDPAIVDTIMDRSSSALIQALQAEAYDEEAELAKLKNDYEESEEYLNAQKEDQRALMLEKLDSRKSAIRARQAEKRSIAAAEAATIREKGKEGKLSEEQITAEIKANSENIKAGEIAVIISKVEENVFDACHATSEANDILSKFKEAKAGQEKGSLEAKLRQKDILEERLAIRREKKLASQAEQGETNEAPALSEKWQEVEEDLVEQAVQAYENEIGDMMEINSDEIDSVAQAAVLAKVMWQLDRDIAHAEELRNREWASTEASSILKKYDEAAKRANTVQKEQMAEQRKMLDGRLEKRKAARTKKKVRELWGNATSMAKRTMGVPQDRPSITQAMSLLNNDTTTLYI